MALLSFLCWLSDHNCSLQRKLRKLSIKSNVLRRTFLSLGHLISSNFAARHRHYCAMELGMCPRKLNDPWWGVLWGQHDIGSHSLLTPAILDSSVQASTHTKLVLLHYSNWSQRGENTPSLFKLKTTKQESLRCGTKNLRFFAEPHS